MNLVSIITVNYNGKRTLGNFLNSIRELNYPKEKLQTILVDNNSTDDSVGFVTKNFPEVMVIRAKENLGFSKGNNLGIKKSEGDLIFLVNNDTALEKNSLRDLVSCYQRGSGKEKIGAVCPKILLFDYYLHFILRGAAFYSSFIKEGSSPFNNMPFVFRNEDSARYEENFFLPLDHNLNEPRVKISILVKRAGGSKIELVLGTKRIVKAFKLNDDLQKVILNLTKYEILKLKVDLIQNAGNFIFSDGYGRDRGAEIIDNKQFYEADRGQYNNEESVPSFCGAGVVLNKEALKDVGLFDEKFFMYYEDDDLSLRMKKKGWEIVYCPKAIIRHIHSASSKEWSPFFVFNVERNRLLLVAKHWPRTEALKEFIKFLLIDTIGVFFYSAFKIKKSQNLIEDPRKRYIKKFGIRIKIIFSLILPFLVSMVFGRKFSHQKIQDFWKTK